MSERIDLEFIVAEDFLSGFELNDFAFDQLNKLKMICNSSGF